MLLLQLFQQIIHELGAGGPVPVAGHDHSSLRFRAEAHSGGKLICLVRHGDVPQQQLCRLQNAGGIGVVPLAVSDETGGGAVDGLEHSILTAVLALPAVPTPP